MRPNAVKKDMAEKPASGTSGESERSPEELASAGDDAARAGRQSEALSLFEEVLSRYGASADPIVRGWVGWALERKADVLEELGSVEQSVVVRHESLTRFRDD